MPRFGGPGACPTEWGTLSVVVKTQAGLVGLNGALIALAIALGELLHAPWAMAVPFVLEADVLGVDVLAAAAPWLVHESLLSSMAGLPQAMSSSAHLLMSFLPSAMVEDLQVVAVGHAREGSASAL